MSKPWQKKKEAAQEKAEPKKKSWTDCGYLAVSKRGNVLSVVVKHQRYVVNLQEANEVVEGQRGYALIYEFVGEKSGQRD